MCGRYYIDDETYYEIQNIVSDMDRRIRNTWNRDILPTESAPVMISSENERILKPLSFGYRSGTNHGLIINARVESVNEKPMFQNGMRYRRAVVPATHFYEWNALKEKSTFRRTDGGTLFFAGLWNAQEQFVIMTTAANSSMKTVHDRMPLILERGQLNDWLFDTEAAMEIIRQEPVLLHRESEYEQMTLFSI